MSLVLIYFASTVYAISFQSRGQRGHLLSEHHPHLWCGILMAKGKEQDSLWRQTVAHKASSKNKLVLLLIHFIGWSKSHWHTWHWRKEIHFTYSKVMQDILQCVKICKPPRQKEREKQMIWNHNAINHTNSRRKLFFLKPLSSSNYISYVIKVTEITIEN